METLVLPGIENVYRRERAKDELPQSGSGRTIMTAEPKFVPEEAAEIALDGDGTCKVRLVDCVGYLVDGALGHTEEDAPRMVSTPWSDQPMPMAEAAELGTRKVIADHSTIGLVVTSRAKTISRRKTVLSASCSACTSHFWYWSTLSSRRVRQHRKSAARSRIPTM